MRYKSYNDMTINHYDMIYDNIIKKESIDRYDVRKIMKIEEEDIKPYSYNEIINSVLEKEYISNEENIDLDKLMKKSIQDNIKIENTQDYYIGRIEASYIMDDINKKMDSIFGKKDNNRENLILLSDAEKEIKSIDENKLKKILNYIKSENFHLNRFDDVIETPENIIKKISKIIQSHLIDLNNYIKVINEKIRYESYLDKINSSVFVL